MVMQILVPLDGSTLAERALPWATAVARATGATVHLARVDETAVLIGRMPSAIAPVVLYDTVIATQSAEGTAYLATLRTRLQASDLHVQTALLDGDPAAALLDYERTAAIDRVVMCSHGRGGLTRFMLGSVADRLLHEGTVPLLLVHAVSPPRGLRQVVVPLDGSPRAEAALPLVEQMAGTLIQSVTLLRAVATLAEEPAARRYLEMVVQRLEQSHLRVRTRIVQGDAVQAIRAEAGATVPVVMATHGRTGLTRLALGSVADRVAHGGTATVLLVRVDASQAKG